MLRSCMDHLWLVARLFDQDPFDISNSMKLPGDTMFLSFFLKFMSVQGLLLNLEQ